MNEQTVGKGISKVKYAVENAKESPRKDQIRPCQRIMSYPADSCVCVCVMVVVVCLVVHEAQLMSDTSPSADQPLSARPIL